MMGYALIHTRFIFAVYATPLSLEWHTVFVVVELLKRCIDVYFFSIIISERNVTHENDGCRKKIRI